MQDAFFSILLDVRGRNYRYRSRRSRTMSQSSGTERSRIVQKSQIAFITLSGVRLARATEPTVRHLLDCLRVLSGRKYGTCRASATSIVITSEVIEGRPSAGDSEVETSADRQGNRSEEGVQM